MAPGGTRTTTACGPPTSPYRGRDGRQRGGAHPARVLHRTEGPNPAPRPGGVFSRRPRDGAVPLGVRLGVQRCLFYLGLRRIDLEPLVGIWPAAGAGLCRLSVVLAPDRDRRSVLPPSLSRRGHDEPARRGSHVAHPPATRRRQALYPFVEAATPMLLTLPDWLETLTGLSLESRVGLALQALRLTLIPRPPMEGSGAAGSGGASRRAPRPPRRWLPERRPMRGCAARSRNGGTWS